MNGDTPPSETEPTPKISQKDKTEWCIGKIEELERAIGELARTVEQLTPPLPKPWYTQAGIWFALFNTSVVLYLVYLFYMSELGYTIALPF